MKKFVASVNLKFFSSIVLIIVLVGLVFNWIVLIYRGEETDHDIVIISDVGAFTDRDAILVSNWTTYWLFTPKPNMLKIVFFTDDVSKWQTAFPNVNVKNYPERTCNVMLSINGMFTTAMATYRSYFYMFVNRRTLVSKEILKTIRVVHQLDSVTNETPVLAVARSRTVLDDKRGLQILDAGKNVRLSDVKYSRYGASDIFLVNRNFEWSRVPKMLTQETATSDILLTLSRQNKVILVDVTKSVNVVKIKPKDEKKRLSSMVKRCIKNMFITAATQAETARLCGNIMCVGMETTLEKGKVKVVSREVDARCNDCMVVQENDPVWLPK